MASHRSTSSASRFSGRRKYAAVALAVVGVAGLSLASASQLTLTGGTLQAGQVSADCQTASIPVSYTSSWDATNKYYVVSNVTLSAVDAACNSKAVEVKLLKADGTAVATLTGTATTGVTSLAVSPTIRVTEIASLAAIIKS